MHVGVRVDDTVVMLADGAAPGRRFPCGFTSACPTWMRRTAAPWWVSTQVEWPIQAWLGLDSPFWRLTPGW